MGKPEKILITGGSGFIAKNACEYFSGHYNVECVSHNCPDEELIEKAIGADILFHFAAVQRSNDVDEFWLGNVGYTKRIVQLLEEAGHIIPILFTTSIGIEKKSVFSETKLEAERIIREYGRKYSIPIYVFKLNNLFGKHGKPNFNNVIATFCYNVANGLPITVNDPGVLLQFTYIDDVMKDFEDVLGKEVREYYYSATIKYRRSLGEVINAVANAKLGRKIEDEFGRKIQLTYKTYCMEN